MSEVGVFDNFVNEFFGGAIRGASAEAMASGVDITCKHFDQIMYDTNLSDSEKVMVMQVMSTDLQEQAEEWKVAGDVAPASEERTQKQIKTLGELTKTMICLRQIDFQKGME